MLFGRTGPRQGCDPLPFLDLVRTHYPPEKVGLFYGGDYGLRYPEIRHHVQDHRNVGFIFMREVEQAPTMTFKPEYFPPTCWLDDAWGFVIFHLLPMGNSKTAEGHVDAMLEKLDKRCWPGMLLTAIFLDASNRTCYFWRDAVRRWGGLRRQFWKYYVGFVQPLLGPDVGRVAATGILQVLTESCTPAILPP